MLLIAIEPWSKADANRILQEVEENKLEVEVKLKQSKERVKVAREAEATLRMENKQSEMRINELEMKLVALERETTDEKRTHSSKQGSRAGERERHWLVRKEEVCLTGEKLGRGSWGEMKVADFRGTRVAAYYQSVKNDLYYNIFVREMDVAARLHHPNLVQFIGA